MKKIPFFIKAGTIRLRTNFIRYEEDSDKCILFYYTDMDRYGSNVVQVFFNTAEEKLDFLKGLDDIFLGFNQ